MKVLLLPFVLVLYGALGAPVKKTDAKDAADDDMAQHLAEYKRYVKQVLDVLEDHPEIRERIRAATSEEVADGKLSDEVARLAPHHIRSQLDEAKRQTVQRQRIILKRRMEQKEGARQRIDSHDDDVFGGEIPNFDANDLKQVMLTRLDELKKEDKDRRDQFMKLEMDKEHQRRVALKKMNEKDRLEAEEKHKFVQEKRKEHPKMHHPGSEAQLKEVWEEEDGLDEQDFDPRTFFELHDTNDDGYLDTFELEALFIHEVSKVYTGDESDSPEMHEELARMREHVFQEVDKDQDALISYDEFKSSTELQSFAEDPGWEGLDEEELYTDEEMDEYERMLQQEMEAIDQESQELIEKNRIEAEEPQQREDIKHDSEQLRHDGNVPVGLHGEEAIKVEEAHKQEEKQEEKKENEEKKPEEQHVEANEEKKEEVHKSITEKPHEEKQQEQQQHQEAAGEKQGEADVGQTQTQDQKEPEKVEQAQDEANKKPDGDAAKQE